MDTLDNIAAELDNTKSTDATTKEVSFAVIGFVFGMTTGVMVTVYLFLNNFGA